MQHRLWLLCPLDWDGILERIHHALYQQCQEQAGHEPSPTAATTGSRSVKGAEKGGLHQSAGLRRGQEIKGKKRHVLVDTQGLLLHAIVHAADIQDPSGDGEAASLRESRDGGVPLMATLFSLHPFLRKLYADGGYAGLLFQAGLGRVCRQVNVGIVKRSDAGKFVVLPKCWIVEVVFTQMTKPDVFAV